MRDMDAEDIALLRMLPMTLSRVPMKRALVGAAMARMLVRIEVLRTAGMLSVHRQFDERTFTQTVLLTPAGADASRRPAP